MCVVSCIPGRCMPRTAGGAPRAAQGCLAQGLGPSQELVASGGLLAQHSGVVHFIQRHLRNEGRQGRAGGW